MNHLFLRWQNQGWNCCKYGYGVEGMYQWTYLMSQITPVSVLGNYTDDNMWLWCGTICQMWCFQYLGSLHGTTGHNYHTRGTWYLTTSLPDCSTTRYLVLESWSTHWLISGPGLVCMSDDLDSNRMHRYNRVVRWLLWKHVRGNRFKFENNNRKLLVLNRLLFILMAVVRCACRYQPYIPLCVACFSISGETPADTCHEFVLDSCLFVQTITYVSKICLINMFLLTIFSIASINESFSCFIYDHSSICICIRYVVWVVLGVFGSFNGELEFGELTMNSNGKGPETGAVDCVYITHKRTHKHNNNNYY